MGADSYVEYRLRNQTCRQAEDGSGLGWTAVGEPAVDERHCDLKRNDGIDL